MEHKEYCLIYLSEFIARFCTWAILSQLLTHLTNIHWGTSAQQLYIVGASLSLLYISAIFGGLVRDFFLVAKWVVALGIGLTALGCLLLFFSPSFFYLGLGLALLGAGMVTSNTPLLLSSLTTARCDNLFTILYGVTNTGVILGSVLGGIMNEYLSWKIMLIFNEIMLFTWLGCCLLSAWLPVLSVLNKKIIRLCGSIVVTIFLVYVYLRFEVASEIILTIAGVGYLSFLVYLMIKHSFLRKQLGSVIFLTLLAIVFFSGEFQVTSTLINYAKNFVKLTVAHVAIPAGSLLALESIFVVLGAFIIARAKFLSKITQVETKVCIGLCFGALAFVVLYISTLVASHHLLSVGWIVLTFLLLGLGDVYLMPPIIAYIADIAPVHYKGRLMAGTYFALSLSGYLSGLIGAVLSRNFVSPNTNLTFYSTGFCVMVVALSVAVGLVLTSRIIGVVFYPKH